MIPVVVAFIFARGGSKGIPRKNLALLNGKSLLAHAIDAARACPLIDRVIVSTDDLEIAEAARAVGAEVPFMRPVELADDSSKELDAWRHAIAYLRDAGDSLTTFVSVPTTAPLRLPEDLAACIDLYEQSDSDVVITVRDAERNPCFNMTKVASNGCCQLVLPRPDIATRQAAPVVYDVTTVAYVADPDFIMNADSYWEGRVRAVRLPWTRALDIDRPFDLKLAELLLRDEMVETEAAYALGC